MPLTKSRLILFLLLGWTVGPACADDAQQAYVPPPEDRADASQDTRPITFDAAAGAPTPGSDARPSERVDPTTFNCPDVPTAYVFEHRDAFTDVMGASDLLARAGFMVKPLPLDQSPANLQGLIFIGSFATESPDYRNYLKSYASSLYTFVDKANVLVEMTQADQTEAMPPFLPSGYIAQRHDLDVDALEVLDPKHPLLAGVPVKDGRLAWQGSPLGWETFVTQAGFAVLLAGDGSGGNAALMESAYGQGRIVLSAMAFDKPLGTSAGKPPFPNAIGTPEARDAFNQAFFANLYQHVRDVCRRQTPALIITPSSAHPVFSPGSEMLAVLPDTQYYSLSFPGIYDSQTSWIASNARTRRIAYVLHLGDIVNNNTPDEWRHAAASMALLDGVVPYALQVGNHDLGPSGDASSRDTLMNEYFSFAKTSAWPTFGGAYDPGRLDNTYHLFTLGGRDYIVISVEWGPRDATLEWANQVMLQNPDRIGILITHAYVNHTNLRYDHNDRLHGQDFNPHNYGTPGGINDGEEMWQKLVRRHRFAFVFSGHVLAPGTGYVASVTDKGNTCHQMLSNYQFRNLGGEGYMRLVEFLPDGKTVRVFTYSPLYDRFLVEPTQSFSFTLDLPPPRAP